MKKTKWGSWTSKLAIVALVSTLVLAGCSGEKQNNSNASNQNAGGELKKVKVVLDWSPNTNHTGLYVARDNGYFKEQGLDVEIIQPGQDGANRMVAAGAAEFGIGYQESMTTARVAGVPLVSIAAIIQHNTSGFASPKEKGIDSPEKFEGQRYGGWGEPVEAAVIESIMRTKNADINKVDILSIGDSDFFTAVQRDIDFAWIYYAWTGVNAELRGEPINMIYLTDYSDKLDYYTPTLITNEALIISIARSTKGRTLAPPGVLGIICILTSALAIVTLLLLSIIYFAGKKSFVNAFSASSLSVRSLFSYIQSA